PRAEPEAGGGAEEEREEHQVGKAEARDAGLARDREAEGERRDAARMLEDPARRPPEDRVDVDPGDERGDQRHPGRALEDGEEDERGRRRSTKLREACDVDRAGGLEGACRGAECEREEEELHERRAPERERDVDEAEDGRHEQEREAGDGPPEREAWPRAGGRVVGGEGGREGDERGDAAAQYGGSSAHQGPSALKAFQKRVFAACSSSDSSTSGTTSASIVGVKRWRPSVSGSTGSASGNSTELRRRRRARPSRRRAW